MGNEISLATWLKAERHRLAEFAEFWRRMSAIEPHKYPSRMPPGDWDEQLAAFEYNL
jgi:hypothetical protein